MFKRQVSLILCVPLVMGAFTSNFAAAPPLNTLVYSVVFEPNDEPLEYKHPGITAKWTPFKTARSPSGRKFLGQFGNDEVRLDLGALYPHVSVTVEFDLLLGGNWGGNGVCFQNRPNGPDIFNLRVGRGPTLLFTTFSNVTGHQQAFPGRFPERRYSPCGGATDGIPFNAARTGAAETNTLGYPLDSVYHFTFHFSHSAPSLVLNFLSNVTSPDQEKFGLDNVKVFVISRGGHGPPTGVLNPDLVLRLSSPVTATAGEDIGRAISVTASNIGFAAAPGTEGTLNPANGYTIDVTLSTDETVPPGFATPSSNFTEDMLLQGGSINTTTDLQSRASKTYGIIMMGRTRGELRGGVGRIPPDTITGLYYICARIDPGNKVAEVSETNNVSCTQIKIKGRSGSNFEQVRGVRAEVAAIKPLLINPLITSACFKAFCRLVACGEAATELGSEPLCKKERDELQSACPVVEWNIRIR
jgi:hypothetical protein